MKLKRQCDGPVIRFYPARWHLRQHFCLFLWVDRNRAEGNRGLSPVVPLVSFWKCGPFSLLLNHVPAFVVDALGARFFFLAGKALSI